MTRTLVAYATRHGSTAEVAETVAQALRGRGDVVDVVPAGTVREPVSEQDLVVLAAPLYSGRWHRDARRFLRRHRDELRDIPLAVFALGPREDTDEAWERARAQLDRALARYGGGLVPAAVAVFGGVDPPRRRDGPRRDLRTRTPSVTGPSTCRTPRTLRARG
jgi:menaquinone-dependent protoporphyrinogen oxidase